MRIHNQWPGVRYFVACRFQIAGKEIMRIEPKEAEDYGVVTRDFIRKRRKVGGVFLA